MNEAIYSKLKEIARTQDYTTYSRIAPLAHLDMESPADRNQIAQVLDQISRHEHSLGHPLLSAVVIHSDDNIPGQGFFKLARDLGLYQGKDDMRYWLDELKRVHAHWAAPS